MQAEDRPNLGSGPGILARGKAYTGLLPSQLLPLPMAPAPYPPVSLTCVCINTSGNHKQDGRLQAPHVSGVGLSFSSCSKPLWTLTPYPGLSRAEY